MKKMRIDVADDAGKRLTLAAINRCYIFRHRISKNVGKKAKAQVVVELLKCSTDQLSGPNKNPDVSHIRNLKFNIQNTYNYSTLCKPAFAF